jgi:hypothetical protein
MRLLVRYSISISLGLLLPLLSPVAPAAFPQQPATASGDCNQPMTNPNTQVKVDGNPRFSVATRNGCWIFVVVTSLKPSVTVLRREGGTVKQIRSVQVSGPTQLKLTHDERTLVVAADRQITFLDVSKLISSQSDAMLGSLTDPHFSATSSPAITADDSFMFVGNLETQWISVVDLGKALREGFKPNSIVGGIPLDGPFPGSWVFSRDGRHLFAPGGPDTSARACGDFTNPRTVMALDVERAKSDPKSSILTSVCVGLPPVSLALSPDGDTLYVSTRDDDRFHALDIRPVRSGNAPVLIGSISVGPSPRGIGVVDGGKKIVAAVNNGPRPGARESYLAVIDSSKIADSDSAILGTIPAGIDARQVFVMADGKTLLITNYGSQTLQIVDMERVKLEPIKK